MKKFALYSVLIIALVSKFSAGFNFPLKETFGKKPDYQTSLDSMIAREEPLYEMQEAIYSLLSNWFIEDSEGALAGLRNSYDLHGELNDQFMTEAMGLFFILDAQKCLVTLDHMSLNDPGWRAKCVTSLSTYLGLNAMTTYLNWVFQSDPYRETKILSYIYNFQGESFRPVANYLNQMAKHDQISDLLMREFYLNYLHLNPEEAVDWFHYRFPDVRLKQAHAHDFLMQAIATVPDRTIKTCNDTIFMQSVFGRTTIKQAQNEYNDLMGNLITGLCQSPRAHLARSLVDNITDTLSHFNFEVMITSAMEKTAPQSYWGSTVKRNNLKLKASDLLVKSRRVMADQPEPEFSILINGKEKPLTRIEGVYVLYHTTRKGDSVQLESRNMDMRKGYFSRPPFPLVSFPENRMFFKIEPGENYKIAFPDGYQILIRDMTSE